MQYSHKPEKENKRLVPTCTIFPIHSLVYSGSKNMNINTNAYVYAIDPGKVVNSANFRLVYLG